ncbi:unnamed protein product, partial [Amoebophrya sp. A25]
SACAQPRCSSESGQNQDGAPLKNTEVDGSKDNKKGTRIPPEEHDDVDFDEHTNIAFLENVTSTSTVGRGARAALGSESWHLAPRIHWWEKGILKTKYRTNWKKINATIAAIVQQGVLLTTRSKQAEVTHEDKTEDERTSKKSEHKEDTIAQVPKDWTPSLGESSRRIENRAEWADDDRILGLGDIGNNRKSDYLLGGRGSSSSTALESYASLVWLNHLEIGCAHRIVEERKEVAPGSAETSGTTGTNVICHYRSRTGGPAPAAFASNTSAKWKETINDARIRANIFPVQRLWSECAHTAGIGEANVRGVMEVGLSFGKISQEQHDEKEGKTDEGEQGAMIEVDSTNGVVSKIADAESSRQLHQHDNRQPTCDTLLRPAGNWAEGAVVAAVCGWQMLGALLFDGVFVNRTLKDLGGSGFSFRNEVQLLHSLRPNSCRLQEGQGLVEDHAVTYTRSHIPARAARNLEQGVGVDDLVVLKQQVEDWKPTPASATSPSTSFSAEAKNKT